MAEFLIITFVVLLIAVGFTLHRVRMRDTALARVAVDPDAEEEHTRSRRVRSVLVRWRWVPLVGAIVAFLVMNLGFDVAFWLAAAFAFVFGSIMWIAEEFAAGRRELKIDEQVADAIDIIVSALRAGTGLVDALTIASSEARRPVRRCLEEVVNRLRLGDTPSVVFHDFSRRIPLEGAELLAFTLSVHWNVGGSLAPALATVARSTRHRIEFARRVRSQATEGRASVIGMLGITYLLGFMMYKAYPERFDMFLGSSVGIGLTATVVFLEGLGLVWMSMLTRIKP